MKKVFALTIVLLAMLIPVSCVLAQTINWQTANQATIGWNAVTQLESGATIPAGDVVKYTAYVKNQIGTIAQINANPITATEITITFTQEGKYVAGVKAMRFDSAGTLLTESVVVWSDTPANCADITGDGQGDPFGFLFYVKPKAVGNLKNVP